MARNTISIKDIARAANVSHPTVSRALRNSPLVNDETARRIQQIAREMGYQPSAVGRSLVTQKTQKIGAVVTNVTDPFIAEVVGVVEEVANNNGYSVLLANSNADPDREMKAVRTMHEQRVDGVMVMASRVGALYIPLLAQLNVPVVLIDNQYPEDFVHSILIDNVAGARDATAHLITQGHRHIAYIGDRYGYQSETERFRGYCQAMVGGDVPALPELITKGDGKAEGGITAMEELLSLPKPPTGVFCYNDMTALGALHTIHSHGLRVPDDISVVGFDDISFASFSNPPLTTIRQPREQMGRRAVEILLDLFAGRKPQENITVRGDLIIRASTGPPHSPVVVTKPQV